MSLPAQYGNKTILLWPKKHWKRDCKICKTADTMKRKQGQLLPFVLYIPKPWDFLEKSYIYYVQWETHHKCKTGEAKTFLAHALDDQLYKGTAVKILHLFWYMMSLSDEFAEYDLYPAHIFSAKAKSSVPFEAWQKVMVQRSGRWMNHRSFIQEAGIHVPLQAKFNVCFFKIYIHVWLIFLLHKPQHIC